MERFDNPFDGYGKIVCGDRFIGREASIKLIENRVVYPKNPGNLAIVGNYRIGKSSLVYKSIIERKNELLVNNKLPIWVNIATYDEAAGFFQGLVERTVEELYEMGTSDDIMSLGNNLLQQKGLSWHELYSRIQRFFSRLRKTNIKVLLILDEFDNVRHLFKNSISLFQALRELAYNPEWGITLITTSRRSLRDIEVQMQSISNLDLIFQKHYLGMFDESDLNLYFDRLQATGVELTPELLENISFYCGGHPFLLDIIGYEIVETKHRETTIDMRRVVKRTEHLFLDYYYHTVNILSEEGSLNKLLEILFGPVYSIKDSDVDTFLRLGLIKENGEKFVAFSGHFQQYLKMKERELDLWPIWRNTEISLRNVITEKMTELYGSNWMDYLSKSRPNLVKVFEKCKEMQVKEQTSFGDMASKNLLDFAYPQDLFTIIFSEWETFAKIFGKDKAYWSQRAEFLGKIRNPLAHNRENVLKEYEKQLAEGYCKEILNVLKNI